MSIFSWGSNAAEEGGKRDSAKKPAAEPKPLTDITDAGARDVAAAAEVLRRGNTDGRTVLDENSQRLDALNGQLRNSSLPNLSVVNGGATQALRPTATPAPVTNASAPDIKPPDPELKLVTLEPAVLNQFIALLRQGRVEDFNKLRPAGRLDLRNAELSGMDLRGVDLRHVDLTRAIMSGSNLKGALLQHATLDRADLSGATLTDAQLYRSSFRYADLSSIKDARNAQFHEAVLKGAELNAGNFSGAFFSDASLITASLIGAKFVGAHLERAILVGTVLTNANFECANLTRARLFQSNGEDINFRGANLVDAEALQAFYRSTNTSQGDGGVKKTNFSGAWVHGFRRDASIPTAMLDGSIAESLPPEGTFTSAPAPADEKILVDGIPGTDKVLYDAAMDELNEMIGLTEVKGYVRAMMATLKASQMRVQFTLPKLDYTLHTAYTGSPGTGKTSVGRIMSKLLYSLGCVSKGHLVETDKSGLIAGYEGQTVGKTTETIDRAIGGVLLIDEAYALTMNENDSYSKDAITVLNKRLEDDRDKFACFVCGYTKLMHQFMESNPGLADRFDDFVEFPDYSSGELVQILQLRLDKKHFRVDQEFLGESALLLSALKAKKGENFANGRSVRKCVEQMGQIHAARLEVEGKLHDREELITPVVGDLPWKKLLKIDRAALPPVGELRWKGPDGSEIGYRDLSLNDPFPDLTEESTELIANAVRAVAAESAAAAAEKN